MNWADAWPIYTGVAGFATLFMFWRFYGIGKAIQAGRARELFWLQRELLEKDFLAKASSSGLPRGLLWKCCDFSTDFELVRERKTGLIMALVGATIQFEAAEDGDMVGLPAVPIPRQGSAVLQYERGEWTSVGRVIFNLEPSQVLSHFAPDFEPLPARRHH